MKKLILSALMIGGAAMAAHAQPNSVLVFGDLGIHSTKDANDNKTRSFNINPGIGYQFNRNWTLGLAGGFGTARSRQVNQKEWNFTNTYNAGVFVRHTLPVGKIFAFFSQLEAGYKGMSIGNTGVNTTTNANGFYAKLTPAVAVYVFDGFALNFGFGGIEYNTMKFSGASKASSAFDLTWGSQFNIGVSKNFSCGHMRKHHRGHGPQINHGSRMDKHEIEEDSKESED